MNWYLVKLVFKIDNQLGKTSSEFDEQFRMVEAMHEEEAIAKAKIVGVKNEFTTENAEGVTVSWIFIDVAYVKKLEAFTDGMELFSTTHTSENAKEYINFVHHQAETMYKRVTPHAVMVD